MATARKLPSGSWRCLVYDFTDETGKRIYKSFTSSDTSPKGKREAEKLASEYALNKEKIVKNDKTFAQCATEYISKREKVLSPRTIMDYKRILKKELDSIKDIPIHQIDQDMVQDLINNDADIHSPKTVRNTHGFISAVLKANRPDFALNTRLPQAKKPKLYIPTDEDIKTILRDVRGTEMELPILLAAFGPMRRGEISALHTNNIKGNTVHVCQNMVKKNTDKGYAWIIKVPKTEEGDRFILFPDEVAEFWKDKEGYLVSLNPDRITDRFGRILKRLGIPQFRFHDLRHYSASVQHAMGIPDAYIMQRAGWSSDKVLKNIYRHTLSDREKEMNNIANEHFSKLCNTKMQHK